MSGGAGIDKSQSVPGNGGNGYQALDQSLLSPGRLVNVNSTGKREPSTGTRGVTRKENGRGDNRKGTRLGWSRGLLVWCVG